MSKDIILVTWGGIGDLIVSTPMFRAIKEQYPSRKLIVYCSHSVHLAVLKHNPHINSIRLLRIKSLLRYPYHLFAYLFNRRLLEHHDLNFQLIPPTWIYNMSVKKILLDVLKELEIKTNNFKIELFFTREEENQIKKKLSIYKNVVAIHVHSKASINHHWPIERWEQLVAAFPEVTFIQLGNIGEAQINGALNWLGKTKLREALGIIKFARSFVGVDSSFAHATNAFGIPGVVLFGDSSPVFWGQENNINIYKGLSCSPCYYYMARNNPCPYGHECMKDISVEEVAQALSDQLQKGLTLV